MSDDLQSKQAYLRENVLETGYDADEFMTFLQTKKGENGLDLNNWSMNELITVVDEFVNNKKVKSNPQPEQNEEKEEKNEEEKNQEINQEYNNKIYNNTEIKHDSNIYEKNENNSEKKLKFESKEQNEKVVIRKKEDTKNKQEYIKEIDSKTKSNQTTPSSNKYQISSGSNKNTGNRN